MSDTPPENPAEQQKVKSVLSDSQRSGFRKYRDLCYGDTSLLFVLWSEFLFLTIGLIPGALGLGLRAAFYPTLFRGTGRKVVFGRGVTLRHTKSIVIGDNTIIDDNAVLDAKGSDSSGITIGNNVYVGRSTIIYCKGGTITIQDAVNLSSNCQVFSSNALTIGSGTVIGAFTYLLSGGEYDYKDSTPFAKQSGMNTNGPLNIGNNCWVAARVTVTDAADIGDHCVIGAGAVVTKPIPGNSVAVGIPAAVVKSID